MDDISRHKEALRSKQRELRHLLNDWDPIGVYGPGSEAPVDEYDCLRGVVGMLRGGSSDPNLASYLREELRDHFGIDPDAANPQDFAATLYQWYWLDPLPGSTRPK
jgi:hypothetical protein